MEAFKIEQLELLILVGAMVAIITRRLKIPYTTGLVVAGLLIAFFHVGVSIPLNKELMFDVLLPPLIFEAALYIQWKELRRDLLVIMTYAVLGVALSGGVCAVFMHYFAGWTWLEAMLFGALIAATDPVQEAAFSQPSDLQWKHPVSPRDVLRLEAEVIELLPPRVLMRKHGVVRVKVKLLATGEAGLGTWHQDESELVENVALTYSAELKARRRDEFTGKLTGF